MEKNACFDVEENSLRSKFSLEKNHKTSWGGFLLPFVFKQNFMQRYFIYSKKLPIIIFFNKTIIFQNFYLNLLLRNFFSTSTQYHNFYLRIELSDLDLLRFSFFRTSYTLISFEYWPNLLFFYLTKITAKFTFFHKILKFKSTIRLS